jgi:hypothetical protein
LEVVSEPLQRFCVSHTHGLWRYRGIWKDGAVEELVWRLTEAYDSILQAEAIFVGRIRRQGSVQRVYGPTEGLTTLEYRRKRQLG